MNQNKPLHRGGSYYFNPIYKKKAIKCEEEKLLDPNKLLKPKVIILFPYLRSAKVYPEPMFSELNNLTTNSAE